MEADSKMDICFQSYQENTALTKQGKCFDNKTLHNSTSAKTNILEKC